MQPSAVAAIMFGVRCHSPASWICVAAALLLASCTSPSGSGDAEELAEQSLAAVITVSSPAFADAAPIPREFSCDGDDVSPPLSWDGVPDDAVELALVVDDPEAPRGTYVHWVLFGLDPAVSGLGEGEVPTGARQARNSGGDVGYKGPCPPHGDDAHHYRLTVYALGDRLGAANGAATGEVLSAVSDTAIAKGALTGTFDR
jgi:Raf kinase inhibitor-like YbhB/YbcL family protein